MVLAVLNLRTMPMPAAVAMATGGNVTVSATQPSTTRSGALWFDTTTWRLFIYVTPPGAWFFLC